MRNIAVYALVIGLVVAGFLMGFGDAQRAAGLLLVTGGALAIVKSKSMAKAQQNIDNAAKRYTWNPWGSATPRLFVLWGAGIAIIGLAMLLGL